MHDQENRKATPEKKIADQARTWRTFDQAAVADKSDVQKQRQEYRERQRLRRAIDDAGVR